MAHNVLVLGAGASTHYSFPVASDLVDQAISWQGHGGRLTNCGIQHPTVAEFADQLARSGFTSIDQYVSAIKNQALREVGKQLIAIFLSVNEIQIPRRGPNHWYERVANLLI